MSVIPLGSPTSAARAGSTQAWTPTGNPGAGTPSVCPSMVYGSKSTYLKIQLVPGSALSSLPSIITFNGIGYQAKPTDSDNIKSVVCCLGDTSGPNLSYNSPDVGGAFAVTPGTSFFFRCDTTGITLAQLNAGSVYVYIAVDSATAAQAGSLTFDGAGVDTNVSTTTPWSGSVNHLALFTTTTNKKTSDGTWTIHASGFTASVVFATVTPSCDISNPSGHGTDSYLVSNSFGGSSSGTGTAGTVLTTPATQVRIPLTAGSGTGSFTQHGEITLLTAATGNPSCRQKVNSVVYANPPTNTFNLQFLEADYLSYGGGGTGPSTGVVGSGTTGGTIGAPSESSSEMGPYNIDYEVPFAAQLFTYATGVPTDADAAVSYRVYEMTTGTPILTGTMTVTDSTNTDGFYTASIVATAASGFEVGKTYFIRASATVATIAQAGIVAVFTIQDAPATLAQGVTIISDLTTIQTEIAALPTSSTTAAEVWNYADPGDAPGRATDLGGMLRQIWSYCFNRNAIQSSQQTIYRDNSTDVMLSGTQVATDVAANRAKMS